MSESKDTTSRDVLIEGHDYDGIQEYDNPMPGWWLAIFYITIAWSVFYVIGISVGWLNTYEKDLEKETEWLEGVRAAAIPEEAVTPEYLAEKIASGEYLEVGTSTYATTCASCHGEKGEGGIGPNLTDNAWLHGGSLMEIYTVVDEGVLDKGMPAWGAALSRDKVLGVVHFIDAIRNTNEPGKSPEGTEYVPE